MRNSNIDHRYNDIIGLPHHVSETRPQMPIIDRAAQFAPFAALTGYDSAVRETARITDRKIELDDMEMAILDDRLHILLDKKNDQPLVTFTYFVPDQRKSGGAYVRVSDSIKKVDPIENTIICTSGTAIPIDDLYAIDGDLFDE